MSRKPKAKLKRSDLADLLEELDDSYIFITGTEEEKEEHIKAVLDDILYIFKEINDLKEISAEIDEMEDRRVDLHGHLRNDKRFRELILELASKADLCNIGISMSSDIVREILRKQEDEEGFLTYIISKRLDTEDIITIGKSILWFGYRYDILKIEEYREKILKKAIEENIENILLAIEESQRYYHYDDERRYRFSKLLLPVVVSNKFSEEEKLENIQDSLEFIRKEYEIEIENSVFENNYDIILEKTKKETDYRVLGSFIRYILENHADYGSTFFEILLEKFKRISNLKEYNLAIRSVSDQLLQYLFSDSEFNLLDLINIINNEDDVSIVSLFFAGLYSSTPEKVVEICHNNQFNYKKLLYIIKNEVNFKITTPLFLVLFLKEELKEELTQLIIEKLPGEPFAEKKRVKRSGTDWFDILSKPRRTAQFQMNPSVFEVGKLLEKIELNHPDVIVKLLPNLIPIIKNNFFTLGPYYFDMLISDITGKNLDIERKVYDYPEFMEWLKDNLRKKEEIRYTAVMLNRAKRNFKDLVDEFLPIYNEKKEKEEISK